MKVYAFVGPSGTGKSYRAQKVAGQYNIDYIIDDGILVRNNNIVAGSSAKKAPTKIETVKRALFKDEPQQSEMRKAIRKQRPNSILILGTSDKMVVEIAKNLKLGKIEKTIYITDVASEDEIKNAKNIRINEGKHVIPVPTFEIKKDFSGFLLDPLQIFERYGGDDNSPYIAEKSIIRPTFSYMGKYTISDNVFKQIIEYNAKKFSSISSIIKIRVSKDIEPTIYVEAELQYGYNIMEELAEFKKICVREIERQTTMNVKSFNVLAKKVNIDD